MADKLCVIEYRAKKQWSFFFTMVTYYKKYIKSKHDKKGSNHTQHQW